ncbi:ABC transporter ATP-binding protein [Agrobacterium tumefaciens]|uniref:ABC transporter ATP-binding protein n=1 Tax=Agrobacterium tumefaciens TaxID=358 RepID=UPI000EF1F83B|nr:ABC transporter ATP-binding protein [Agrobacterium tumefaciens]AYM07956.1 glycerol transport system ATP-binding protein [Agrobacterium tumefaciens]NSZ34672.1 ABC transporter ATP-binding protein [Agrobacterium tumefaciens]QLG24418.1 ABC transporter ATP-binding protein [Agrobacterium tumefaciens]UNZ52938.1 ABC transporter ATP-binding protein [Agrobacterium tumefaciens]UXS88276.1 ABC transporter ATP-binding protein [Agrobacterium tumefaciens]
MLELRNVSKMVGGEYHIHPIDLTLQRGSLNVLLGPTLSGKTTLMRLMAGLDKPSAGAIFFNGEDVTGFPVQKRNVAMVYQQFINYPALSVYENIASPMRVAGKDQATIDREVRKAAELLKLTPYLDRTPLNLSGGQQQRTALARAIVKNANLVLLDEPLANLDYKLREELREELPRIFAESGAIFVYATTEPSEALLLGGNTATLNEGRVTQFSRTIEVYRRPVDIVTAEIFADPPLNTIEVIKTGGAFTRADQAVVAVPAHLAAVPDGPLTIAFQPHHLFPHAKGEARQSIRARTLISEIAGSESFVHVEFSGRRWVMLAHGIHDIEPDRDIELFLDTKHLMAFDANGRAIGEAA